MPHPGLSELHLRPGDAQCEHDLLPCRLALCAATLLMEHPTASENCNAEPACKRPAQTAEMPPRLRPRLWTSRIKTRKHAPCKPTRWYLTLQRTLQVLRELISMRLFH